jgi:endonuclease YncB( thermonuclease family)
MIGSSNHWGWIQWRRILRWGLFCALLLVGASVSFDHVGAFGYAGSDARRFDHKSVIVTRAIDGDTICVRVPDESTETTVHLLGVDAPDLLDAHWAVNAANYTAARTKDRSVTLRLDPIGWRNDRRELLAYVFITDADNLNLDLVHDGQAYADRRTGHSLHASFEEAEKDARAKKRGLWKELKDEEQPAWRREWLKTRGY